jgi:PPM family protein phosphatase
MNEQLDYHGATHVGMVRTENQDNFLIADFECALNLRFGSTLLQIENKSPSCLASVFAIADGMGGHEDGEHASRLVLTSVFEFLRERLRPLATKAPTSLDYPKILNEAIATAHHSLVQDAVSSDKSPAMGSTLTMAIVVGPKAYVAHVGDSRGYLIRGEEISLLTRDHTVQKLRDDLSNGTASMQQRSLFEYVDWSQIRNSEALWNVIAANADAVYPEISEVAIKANDVLLLCSDGLLKHNAEKQIASQIINMESTQSVCDQLIEETNRRGGLDNTTLIVIRVPKSWEESSKVASIDTDSYEVDESSSSTQTHIGLSGDEVQSDTLDHYPDTSDYSTRDS